MDPGDLNVSNTLSIMDSNFDSYTCEVCKETFQRKKHLKDHMLIHTGEEFKCHVCDTYFDCNSSLKKHLATHSLERPYACTICYRSFKNYKSCEKHILMCDVIMPDSTKNKNTGDRVYNNTSALPGGYTYPHLATEQLGLDLTPSAFGDITTDELLRGSTLARDTNEAFGTKRFAKIQAADLARGGTPERRYVCDVCQKAFKKISHLKDHLRSHTGEKPYECPYAPCRLSFSTSGSRKRHMLTHSGDRPYTCPHCHKSFRRIGICESHVRAHLENPESLSDTELARNKPYKCPQPFCLVRLSRKSTLKRHILMHAGKLPYTCTRCSKSFKTWSVKKRHCDNSCRDPDYSQRESRVSYDHPSPSIAADWTPFYPKDDPPQHADYFDQMTTSQDEAYYKLGITDPAIRNVLIESGRAWNESITQGINLDTLGHLYLPNPRGRKPGVSVPPHYFLCQGCGLRFGRKHMEAFKRHLVEQHEIYDYDPSLFT